MGAAPKLDALARLALAPPPVAPARARRSLEIVPPSSARPVRDIEIASRYAGLSFTFEPSPTDTPVDWLSYDHYLVGFSAGKDSLAVLLLLLELGVPRDRIELWHHEVDGGPGELDELRRQGRRFATGAGRSTLMDWPCTRAYCEAIAKAFGVRICFSWKIGGFEGEMVKENARTSGYRFEVLGGGVEETGGTQGKIATRLQFPQVAEDLSVRWCSAYLKIMVAGPAITHQARFLNKRTLFLTGERAEESAGRAHYQVFEKHRSDLAPAPPTDAEGRKVPRPSRHIDHARPVHKWPEAAVWKLIEKYRVKPHPAYLLGWGRVSCAPCIFGSPDQWASLRVVNPEQFQRIADYEGQFGKTIDRHLTVHEKADKGTPFRGMQERDIRAALSRTYDEPVLVDPWTLPRGALLGDASGPI